MKTKLLKLAKMLLNLKMIDSDKGTLIIESDLAVGVEVSVEDTEGNVKPAEDGEYIVDSQKVVIKEGKVESIETIEPETEETTETEEEPTVEPEPMAEEPATETEEANEPDEKDLRIAELEGLLKDRDAVIEELTAKIKELEDKINQPVEEPVKMSATAKETKINAKGALRYFEK